MIARHLLLAGVAIIALPGVASAQTTDLRTGGTAFGTVAPSSADSAPADREVTFDLEVSEDESKASAQVGGYWTHDTPDPEGGYSHLSGSWSLSLGLPVGGGDDLAVQSLNTLTRGPTVTAGVSFLRFGSTESNANALTKLSQGGARTRCVAASDAAGPLIGATVFESRNLLVGQDGKPLIDADRADALAEIAERANKALAAANVDAPEKVVSVAVSAAIAELGKGGDAEAVRKAAVAAADKQASQPAPTGVPPRPDGTPAMVGACEHPGPAGTVFLRRFSGKSNAYVNRLAFTSTQRFGFEVEVGVNRFDYLDATTLTVMDPAKPSFSGSAFWGHYFPSGVSALIGRVQYQTGYEAVDAVVVCKPVVADPAKDCAKGSPSAPTHFERVNFSVEFRQIVQTGWKVGDLAVAPKGTYDVLSNDFELSFPVFFVPAGDSSISPGFSITYSSKKDAVDFGLFLRKSFKF